SRELSGIILPHDYYGSHLNAKLETVDEILERQNFKHAGNVLSDVWNKVVIDGYPVQSEYVDPDNSEISHQNLEPVNPVWFGTHVRTSQYCLQIVKCSDGKCCKPARSSFFHVMRSKFLPSPTPLLQTENGLKCSRDVSAEFAPLFVLNSIGMDTGM